MKTVFFHAACASLYFYAANYDLYLTKKFNLMLPIRGVYASKLVWLTMINLLFQVLYHLVAALLGLYRLCAGQPRSFKRQFDKYSTTLFLPISFTVVLMFWALYFFDPGSVADEQAQRVLAIQWFNHTLHTFPLIAMVIDHLLWKHQRTKRIAAFWVVLSFSCFYISWIHYVFYVHNFWAYPILGQLSFVGRIALIGVACLVFYSAYLFGDFLTYMVHSGTGNNGSGGVPAVATTSKAHKKYRGYGKRSKN